MSNQKNYQLEINLKEIGWKDVFSESYKIALRDTFVNQNWPKDHSFKNHAHSFVNQIKQNNVPATKREFKKYEIYVVRFGMNYGSEINGDRPALVYKNDDFTLGDDITVIPLTSAYQQRQTDRFDIQLQKDNQNNLFTPSFLRLRQFRAVAKARIWKRLGTLTNPEVITSVDTLMKQMLGLK